MPSEIHGKSKPISKIIQQCEFLFANVGFDTAGNEPCEVCPLFVDGSGAGIAIATEPEVDSKVALYENYIEN